MTSLTLNDGNSYSPLSICVFCGAGDGNDPAFANAARDLADLFKKNNWSLGELLIRGARR